VSSLVENHPLHNLDFDISLSSPLYIMYTSGSTGFPKGVVVEHSQVMNLLQNQKEEFKIDSTDRILQFSEVSFDASVEQIFLAFCSGATLVGVDRSILLDASRMGDFLKEEEITHLHGVPSFLKGLDLRGHKSIRRVISGGDVCYLDMLDKLGIDQMYNEYGPTEATVTCIQTLITRDNKNDSHSVIGRPISNTQVYILGSYDVLQPIGVV
ncbi:AMP-binding protein, partial [Aquimarina algiphila]